MNKFSKKFSFLFLSFMLIFISCSKISISEDNLELKEKSCYIFYDAGSSGTRLYLYEKREKDWIVHKGKKSSALSDSILKNKKIDTIVSELASSLDTLNYDWSKKCQNLSVRVYATGGMRIAEQKYPQKSIKLWKKIRQALIEKIGSSADIVTRTITGFEEGLYAWLALREEKKDNNFGLVEMGGVSSQIVFPCSECNLSSFVKKININSISLQLYSYSFLGLGQDEAIDSLGFPKSCVYGIGEKNKSWSEQNCSSNIHFNNKQSILDPLNYIDGIKSRYVFLSPYQKNITHWYLTGAFKYITEKDVENCCFNKGKCYQKDTSCFRAIYLKKYLSTLDIPLASKKEDVSWTKGAIICECEKCLPPQSKFSCRWRKKGCLNENSYL